MEVGSQGPLQKHLDCLKIRAVKGLLARVSPWSCCCSSLFRSETQNKGLFNWGSFYSFLLGRGLQIPTFPDDVIGSQHSRCPSLNKPTFHPVKLVVLSQNTQLNKTMSLGHRKCFNSFSNLSLSPCGSVLNS